jgi:hypothetical protein
MNVQGYCWASWGAEYARGCMSANDSVARYHLHAAHCTEIALRTSNTENRLALLAMAQSWLALAEQAEKNSETVLVYETPYAEADTFGSRK